MSIVLFFVLNFTFTVITMGSWFSKKEIVFVNSVLKELCQLLNIDHVKSTPYYHETLGSIERNHQEFNEYLRSYLTDDSYWGILPIFCLLLQYILSFKFQS